MKKIALISSRGGHLYQLYQLKSWWSKYQRFWVTFPGKDVDSLFKNERVFYAYSPESRNIFNALRNILKAIVILSKERPDLLISCGAGIAPPFFLIGKILNIKLIFIEPFDFIAYPSLSTRLILPLVDEYIVQHKEQLKFSKKARLLGSVL